MRKIRTFVPRCDEARLEDRVVLTTAINTSLHHVVAPTGVSQNAINFTSNTYHTLVVDLNTIARNYAVTKNVTAAENALAVVSRLVPYGHQDLLPTWEGSLQALQTAGTLTTTSAANAVSSDLITYLRDGVGVNFNVLKSGVNWNTDSQLNGIYNGRV